MKKKIFTMVFTVAVTASLIVPYFYVSADQYEKEDMFSEAEDPSNDIDFNDLIETETETEIETDDLDIIDPVIIEIGADDVDISPSSKKISIGSSFKIDIVQADPDFWEEYDQDVWEDSYKSSIGSIEYKSKKSYVAKVNTSGIVKGRHKGTTTITTTIYFNNGEKLIRKTKVKVKG